MSTRKQEDLIRMYARVKRESPTSLLRKFGRLKNVGDKTRYLEDIKKELLKMKVVKLKGKTEKDLELDAKKWYQSILKQAKGVGVTRLIVGYFYHYTYVSDYYPDLLAYYDTKPLIYLFDKIRKKGKTYLLGINFHWLSKSIRIKFLANLLKSYPNEFENDLPLKLRYADIRKGTFSKGYVAIRKYIRRNIKKKIVRVPNMEILNVTNLRSDKFTGITPERAIQLSKAKVQYRSDVLLNAEKLKQFIKKHGALKGRIKYDKWKRERRRETLKRF